MSATLATEEVLVIETPERVPLHFGLASIGNRFLACAIDHAIQAVALGLIGISALIVASFSFFEQTFTSAPKWVIAVMIILLFLVFAGYFTFFEWIWSGRPITFWEASVRNLLRPLDMFPMGSYSIGLVAVFASTRDQRIGDMVGGTVVVREREAEAPDFMNVFATPVSDPAMRRSFIPVDFTASISSLTESEIQVVETFLRRRWDLNDMVRQWMAWRVSLPILYKLRPTYNLATFTYEGFLEELLHRYVQEHKFRS